ncbi:hypothetical protein FOMPIDRAFT_1088727, partial [Fomitopsis schrenkii]
GLAQFVAGEDLGAEEIKREVRYRHSRLGQLYERSHSRTVSKTIGTPLSEFTSTKEMVQALMDAIEGHRTAYEAGVEHRDISEGNVMMANGRGFLHDFDNGFNWKANRSDGAPDYLRHWRTRSECKERTGTFYFMAVAILQRRDIIHEAHHDLESFYWLLFWLVLRHTTYEYTMGSSPLQDIFGGKSDRCLKEKFFILMFPTELLSVKDNQPLTELLAKFRHLCAQGYNRNNRTEKPTHESVLRIFKEALDSNGWPSDDKAMPY